MPRHHKNLNRLFIEVDLRVGKPFKLDQPQTNYLLNVMRKKQGDQIVLFNGRDGAFLAEIAEAHRKGATVAAIKVLAAQTPAPDLWYMFAPLKSARLDYMVQKATEMGVGHLQPVITQHTQLVGALKIDKMRTHAIEAAEQCEVLNVPKVHDQLSLVQLIEQWEQVHQGRKLVFADESAPAEGASQRLLDIKDRPIALLIGPEGGFSGAERELLLSQEFCVPISLGPRILRADTAAVAALAIIQSNIGDLR
ncbi:16S rRNA (uracil(1498)-N(3))-methyltransferase [Maritalea sp.]|jgi:16S rRNA (uracil1498-N3)-methyltransferase|uniref:16S rRNA (uracil(1498)-N(3))-methyltransferase n=1 Tax=Maritalea sp. TaxID=2003361 RepID=UPI0039E2FE3D